MKFIKLNPEHEKLLAAFAVERKARGFARGKGDGTPVYCREYLLYLEMEKYKLVTDATNEDYLAFLKATRFRNKCRGKGAISKTHYCHIRYAVNSFHEYLHARGLSSPPPSARQLFFNYKREQKKIVGRQRIKKLFKSCHTSLQSVLLALAYGCGLRRSEIIRLELSDLVPAENKLVVRAGKNYKSRTVPIADSMLAIIKSYISERILINTRSNNFLINKAGNQLSQHEIYWQWCAILKTAFYRVSSAGITLHSLRNSVAVHMIDKGADVDFVRRFLGHVAIDTTLLYAKRRRNRFSIKRRIQQYDPL